MGLERVLRAKSVAVIGASRDDRKRGFQAIKTLQTEGYEGGIYPVNPREKRILGLRCYPSILDIQDTVDLALITTPADTIPGIIEACGKKGVAGAVIIAGGFKELGRRGKTMEEKIVRAARRYGVRIIGPNTSGMINVHENLNLVGIRDVPKGDIALLTQSGNVALHLITEARLKSQKGFSYYVGVGNEADIKFHEYLEFFTEDPSTKAILMYVEGLSEGRKFLQQACITTATKPIILLKSGRSAAGSASAGSHTGALAGISEVAATAFRRAGIITIENPDELFPAAESLSSLPPISNKRVAILADGGGHATIASDLLTDHGVSIPRLRRRTQERLREILPPNAAVRNPVDVAGGADSDPALFADCAKILLEDDRVGGLLIVGLFGGYGIRFAESLKFLEEDAAHRMGKLMRKVQKPIILHSLYNFSQTHSLELLRYYNIPVYDSLDVACKCIAVLCEYGHKVARPNRKASFVFHWGARAKKQGREIIEGAQKEGRRVLLEHEGKALLELHGAPVSLDRVAQTAEEAAQVAQELGGEVVLKIVSPDILHKTDAGGVRLHLKTAQDVRKAFQEIVQNAKAFNPEADIKGCLVSRMAGEGVEVIIGTKVDEQFGPVIMFGIGGILVEVVKDVCFYVLPISRTAPMQMLREIKSYPILNGVRGRPPVDKQAICSLLLTVSEIIEAYPEIQEMDLNPVVAHEDGLTIVDARILLKKKGRKGRKAKTTS
ncbi:MAG: acetate--CoA ligase family protein [Deltaproteobacteria bacterium]|nr:acetate--CoA ligase family protein [Deltaproteobacteria bacterium]MBW1923833.1 acetate--CoA ligase family protein [Deltaproteobacteria bacterium]MBW1948550.1 acetate--CoA ligase family protein [Deltaproteobacteria bacterium]MBW2006978.1 acetate--CoA ligase family protein [Deltaproteobacteria bacterium]MBW2102306.1 acetate--CoA ligase family protein [Deltaproteobacteria bacterium]